MALPATTSVRRVAIMKRVDSPALKGSATVRIKLSYMTLLLGPAVAAVAIAAAPIATAAPTAASGPSQVASGPAQDQSGPSQAQPSCDSLGGTQTECQSPGNAQIFDAPPQVDYFPYAGGAT